MQITDAVEFRENLIRQIAEREFAERTGVHCSDLIYCLNKQALRRKMGDQPSEQETLLFSLGWATQRWLTHSWKDAQSIEKDGILVTCDSLQSVLPSSQPVLPGFEPVVPWELKCTYQSSAKPVDENQHWIRQIMAQCYVTGSLYAYLSRFEVMGNWKSVFGKKAEKDLPENSRPTLHCYRLDFSPVELEANWNWLKLRRDMFQNLLAGGPLIGKLYAIPSGQEYECSSWCKFKGAECTVG